MIRRILNAIRRARIAHHDRVAAIAGTATLAAQIHRDWAAAGERMREMHIAQAKRDALIAQCRTVLAHGCPRCRTHYAQPQECDWCPGVTAR